jgi:hypothetical protein
VSGTHVYLADDFGGLHVIDVSVPASPDSVGSCTAASEVADVAVVDSLAYVADGSAGLRIVNIKDPAHPVIVGTRDTPGQTQGIAVRDQVAYVADNGYSGGLRIFDVSDPANPDSIGYLQGYRFARDVALSGRYAYVAFEYGGLYIVDVSVPSAPVLVGTYDTPGAAMAVAVADGLIYVADFDCGMSIYQGYGAAGISARPASAAPPVASLVLRVRGNTIEYAVPRGGKASLKVYNLLGQEVRTIVRGNRTAGRHETRWDGLDNGGRRVASGVYLVRLEAGGQTATAKLLVIR